MENIVVPKSMLKKFLASKGMRVQPESVEKFEKMFRNWADKIANIASQNCKEAKRKTIMPEDFDKDDVEVESDDDSDKDKDDEDSDDDDSDD